jgi:hypothetical protein
MYDNLAKNTEDSKEILKELKKKYELDKNIDEGKLIIKDNFDEKDLELISKLKNINFKEITLSGCGIEDISPLKYMNLSKLKKLDLSNNKIINIEILKKIKCPQLIEINLNNNNICKFDSSIFKDHFPILEKLIIENKNFLQELEYSKEKFFKHNKESLARTAEELKVTVGCVFPKIQDAEMEIRGRHLGTGLPVTLKIHSSEMLEAMIEPAMMIVDSVHSVLEKTPPELAADISDRGIYMTGGGCLVDGLDRLLQEETGINVMIAEDAVSCVALGTGKALDNLDVLDRKARKN